MSTLPVVKMIWAQSLNGAIGKDNQIPWHVKEDFKHFKSLTDGCTVIMGKNTWISLPEKSRPLPGRRNIILTRNPDSFEYEGAETFSSLEEALKTVSSGETAWIMGGAAVYETGLKYASEIAVTDIDIEVKEADAFAPMIPDTFKVSTISLLHYSETGGVHYKFTTYERSNASDNLEFLE